MFHSRTPIIHIVDQLTDFAAGSGRGSSAEFADLAALLWNEREVLEKVLYAVVQEQLILISGLTRWLPHADAAVREAMQTLQAGEVIRAADVDLLARRVGLPVETTLGELAEIAPEPWPTVLLEHRTALRALVHEIRRTFDENQRMLQAGSSATREMLNSLGSTLSTYSSRGTRGSPRAGNAPTWTRSVGRRTSVRTIAELSPRRTAT